MLRQRAAGTVAHPTGMPCAWRSSSFTISQPVSSVSLCRCLGLRRFVHHCVCFRSNSSEIPELIAQAGGLTVTYAHAAHRKSCSPLGSPIRSLALCMVFLFIGLAGAHAAEADLRNEALRVHIASDGSYTISAGSRSPILRAGVAGEVDHRWVKSAEDPTDEVADSDFDDTLGHGRQATVTFTGLARQPDLIYTIRTYEKRLFGEICVQVRNNSGRNMEVQSIRSVEALGSTIVDLHGRPSADRVLSDSFSEDWPPLQIYDLGKAPNGMHRAVGSQTIYNRESKESMFFGALRADRLLTILHLQTKTGANGPSVSTFTVDSTGTTEIMATDEESGVREG